MYTCITFYACIEGHAGILVLVLSAWSLHFLYSKEWSEVVVIARLALTIDHQ